jgi:hypothetical protein
MVGRLQRTMVLGMAMLFLAPLVFAYEVALRNGTVVHFEKYRVVNNELLYLAPSGEERSILLTDINFARTRELNVNANPPLDLASWIDKMNAARKSAPVQKPAPKPLGDVARELGLKPEPGVEDHVFTDDDFPSSPVPPPPPAAAAAPRPAGNPVAAQAAAANTSAATADWAASKAKIQQFLEKTAGMTEGEYAARSLGPNLADVQFPRRDSWQSGIYTAHQRYVTDAQLCISDRVSDEGRAQAIVCSRLDTDKNNVHTQREDGKARAQAWKSRQESFAAY